MNKLVIARQFRRLPPQTRVVLATCIYGTGAGLIAVAFQLAIKWIYNAGLVRLSQQSTATFLAGSFLLLLAGSLMVGFLLNAFCREASGSGIPQLKIAFWKDFGFIPGRVVWVKFLAGAISVGSGCSLGREGPSVQLAGGVGSWLAGWLGEPKQNRRLAAAAGAAAGLAAAFNTPLAAVTFVLEEIISDLNSRLLGGVLLASVIGALVVHGLIGQQPAFTLANIESPAWQTYALVPVIAAAAALIGVLFQHATLGLRARRKRFQRVPAWMLPLLGGMVTWVVGSAAFLSTGYLGAFSLGYDDLSSGLGNTFPWQMAGALLAAKLVTTIASYGFGGCGGIFSPTLFFGGMLGVFFTGLAGLVVHLTPSDQTTLAVVGMSACLGAVVRAPVTSILIVFEMTHQFALVPILMLGALVSQAISRRLEKENFYEALLTQDGHDLDHVMPPRDLVSWQQLPASAIANFKPVTVQDLSPGALRETLRSHPYQHFPVMTEGKLAGILDRSEATEALAQNRAPQLAKAMACRPAQTIQELQMIFIDSVAPLIVVTEPGGDKILGVVTLHDLLRAQQSFASAAGEDPAKAGK
ncbi:MAG TPA: chloride channel protein [Verrucomicrobiae bacterium]|nr:chloride channel protein [Verrucomicrobiae bacterium]